MSGSDITVSIISSAINVNYWAQNFYWFSEEEVSFEMIYVGPFSCPVQLPKNFRYIRATVKPVQCLEVAMRAARGKYIFHVVDDLLPCQSNTLSQMIKFQFALEKNGKYDVITSPLLRRRSGDFPIDEYSFIRGEPKPQIPISIFFRRKLFEKVNGLESKFISSMADTDLVFRLISEHNAEFTFNEKIFLYERDFSGRDAGPLFSRFGSHDLSLLRNLWINSDGSFSGQRLKPTTHFDSQVSLFFSDPPFGRWRNPLSFLFDYYARKYSTFIWRNIKVLLSRIYRH